MWTMGLTQRLAQKGAHSFRTIRRVFYGMAAHEIVVYAVRMRRGMEQLFILVTLGDLIGVPILPPYYSLRLLPYVVPQIRAWKRQLLRQRDFIEADGLDLLG